MYMTIALIVMIFVLFFMLGASYILLKLARRLKSVLNNVESRSSARLKVTEGKIINTLRDFSLPLQKLDSKSDDKKSYEGLPSVHFEAHFAQTLSEQHYLFESLVKETVRQAQDEIVLLNQLMRNGQLSKLVNQDPLTIVGSLPVDIYKRLLPNDVVLKDIINPLHSDEGNKIPLLHLDKRVENSKNLLILNPHVASILFLYPATIKLLSQKISKKLIFPCYIKKSLFQLEWDETFRQEEADNNHYWRWALNKEAHLYIINNSSTTEPLIFSSDIWFLANITQALLKIYFKNECFQFMIENNSRIEFKLDVPPGKHRISFMTNNAGTKQENWFQTLYFALADLNVRVTGAEANKLNQSKGCDNDVAVLSLHNDEHIRNTLHVSGFFEVSAASFSKDEGLSHQLSTTRYLYQDKSYQYLPALTEPESFDPDNIWYFAKRAATLREK